MIDKNQTTEIWQRVPGANQLREIYGYFPTLHDAVVKNIDVRFELKEVIFTIEYNDLVENSAKAVEDKEVATTHFQIRWLDVQVAKLKLYEKDLLGVSFFQTDEFIETRFREYTFGFYGFIVSRSIEILDIKQISDNSQQASELIPLLTITSN